MVFDLERSILYDTIRFYYMFHNVNILGKDIIAYKLSNTLNFKYFNKISIDFSMSKDFMAFYGDTVKGELITSFYLENIKLIDSVDSFIKSVHSDKFRKYLLFNYFNEKSYNLSDEQLKEEIYSLNIKANCKISLAVILNDYEATIKRFTDLLLNISGEIRRIFTSSKYRLRAYVPEKRFLDIMMKKSGKNMSDDTLYCISLLNTYGYLYSDNSDNPVWIFGWSCGSIIELEYEYVNIDFDSIFELFSKDPITSIIDIFLEHKELISADVCRELNKTMNFSTSKVYNNIQDMYNNKVLNINDEATKKTLYSLNAGYFEHAAKILYNQFMYYARSINILNGVAPEDNEIQE